MPAAKRNHRAKPSSAPTMLNTLYLTNDERTVFAQLPQSLKEGWGVVEETGSFQDSDELRSIRFGLMRVQDPHLAKLKEKMHGATSDVEVASLVGSIDFDAVSEADLAELLFAVGPASLTRFIGNFLAHADSDDGVLLVASLSAARHHLLASFAPSPA